MKEDISYCKFNGFEYVLIKKQIKNIYIQIKDAQVIVKSPKNATILSIENILNSKKKWIINKISEQKSILKNKLSYTDGDNIQILGKTYTLKILYVKNAKKRIYRDLNYIYCIFDEKYTKVEKRKQIDMVKKEIEIYYKEIATKEVSNIIKELSNETKLYPKEYRIKKLKATWGICSSKKKISINQNLAAYSRFAIKYVCLHELCHIKYMNHSKDFWKLVESYMPDYKIAKQELRK